jgi:UDP-glucuronate 4-epimerase
MKRLLVTGAAGFIGSQVAELALADGHEVVGIDTLNDAYDVRLKYWRLARLEARPGFEFHRADITDRHVTESLIAQRGPFEAVIHLAARAGVRPSVTDPWTYFDTNSTGTLNVLEGCRRHRIPKFVLSSTSSLYGSHNPLPYHEDADTNRPLSPYAASKKAAEATAYAYHHLHGLDVTVLRYFTVYGPAGRPDMSLFRFVQWVAEDRPVIIMGDGRQSRDFTYVDDIARGTLAALRPLGFEVVNLGSDRPVVLLDVLAHVEELLGKRARIVYRPGHPADVPATWASIDRAKATLDWKPTVGWQDGVAALVSWYTRERRWAREIVTGE